MKLDLKWAYNRLDHLLYIHQNPTSVQAHFGTDDTMDWVGEMIGELRERYGFKATWPQ